MTSLPITHNLFSLKVEIRKFNLFLEKCQVNSKSMYDINKIQNVIKNFFLFLKLVWMVDLFFYLFESCIEIERKINFLISKQNSLNYLSTY